MTELAANDVWNVSFIDHNRLHSLMQTKLSQIVKDATGKLMATSGGRKEKDVIRDFGLDRIKEELEKFHTDFPEFGC